MSSDVKDWNVRFEFDANGAWQLDETFGPTTEQSARAFYNAGIGHPLMRNIELVHRGQVVDQHA
jgi:hypothetical protein